MRHYLLGVNELMIESVFQILDLLPLEYFTSVNRLRGIFTLISVLAANTDSGSLEMRQTFYKLGLQALECLLVATSGTTLFSVVDAGDICGWLIKLGSQLRGFQVNIASMALCKTGVTPLLTHWSYCSKPSSCSSLVDCNQLAFILWCHDTEGIL